jgi:hypothetical protein
MIRRFRRYDVHSMDRRIVVRRDPLSDERAADVREPASTRASGLATGAGLDVGHGEACELASGAGLAAARRTRGPRPG